MNHYDDVSQDIAYDEENYQVQYSKSVKDRAAQSMQQLSDSLNQDPITKPRKLAPKGKTGSKQKNSDFGSAATNLRVTMNKHRSNELPRSQSYSQLHSEDLEADKAFDDDVMYAHDQQENIYLPSRRDVLHLLQNQTLLVQQLEAENRFSNEELASLRLKCAELLGENEQLHQQLKSTYVNEIMLQDIDPLGASQPKKTVIEDLFTSESGDGKSNFKELSRIQSLHAVQSAKVEAQIMQLRENLKSSEKEVEDLKAKLRSQQATSLSSTIGGASLCIQCAQKEAHAPSALEIQRNTNRMLVNERDALVSQLAAAQLKVKELIGKEEEAYHQVKKCVQTAEQAQVECAQAHWQRDTLHQELEAMRSRLSDYTGKLQKEMLNDRNEANHKFKKENDKLCSKVSEMEEDLINVQTQLERVSRDKAALQNEVSLLKKPNGYSESITDSIRVRLSQAGMEREAAIEELRRARDNFQHLEQQWEGERTRLKTENNDIRRRLDIAEKTSIDAKEESIRIHEKFLDAERQANLLKLAKEATEKNKNQDLSFLSYQSQQREQELNSLLANQQTKTSQNIAELERIIDSQADLIKNIKNECRQVTDRLQEVTDKYKHDVKRVRSQNQELNGQLENLKRQRSELEEQFHSNNSITERLRSRLEGLDRHSANCSRQITELLTRESSLLRDRQLLAREVNYLQKQFCKLNNVELQQFYSIRRRAVETIMESLRNKGELEQSVGDHDNRPIQRDEQQDSREHVIDDDDDDADDDDDNRSDDFDEFKQTKDIELNEQFLE